jgi:long-chain acyl-CoA synthetase
MSFTFLNKLIPRSKVREGYGLTEMAPLIGVSRFEKGGVMIGTVGPVVDGVDVKFAEDGEILAKGPNVMMGYYNHPDVTAGVMDDEGYFHTGDIGEIVNGKFLKITDRKKEIFKTSGGKYVAPQPVENKFKGSSFIENVMLVGDNRNFVAAIIIPEFNHLESWCRIKGHDFVSPDHIIKNETVIKRYQRIVDEFNEELDQVQKVKKFILLADEWSVETGVLSPTLKLKRKRLNEKYQTLIDGFYD